MSALSPTPTEALRQSLERHGVEHAPRVIVAFSGGADSTALLLLAEGWCRRRAVPLHALHVDHRMHAASARWSDHAQALCHRLGVTVTGVAVDAPPASETEARERRYALFADHLGPEEVLLLAHHRDDQVETSLLNLLRGCSLAGAAGMPEARPLGAGRLVRPLLAVDRESLRAAVQAAGLDWIDDPGNGRLDADRNVLRHEVLPMLRHHWPAAAKTLARSIDHLGEDHRILSAVIEADRSAVSDGDRLDVPRWAALPEDRRRAVLRAWLRSLDLPPPDHRQLAELEHQALEARGDAKVCVAWPGAEVRRFRDQLHAAAPRRGPPDTAELPWCDRAVDLPAGLGCLAWSGPTRGAWPELRVRFRRGGERMVVHRRAGRRPLKKLLQEARIPPWERDRLPLVYRGGELLAVGDLLTSPTWRDLERELGAQLVWERG